MKTPRSRTLRRFIVISLGITLTLFVSGTSISFYIAKKIDEKITSLNGKSSATRVNLFTRSVHIRNLEWTSIANSGYSIPHSAKFASVSINGVAIYHLLVNKKVQVDKITVEDGAILYNKKKSGTAQSKLNPDSQYKSFFVENIIFKNVSVQINSDTVVSFSALANFHIENILLKIDSLSKLHYTAGKVGALLENINISRHKGLYGGTVKSIYLNTHRQTVSIDSVLLIPNYTKFEFAQRLGKETGRVNLSVPQLIIEGIDFEKLRDSIFTASKIEIHSFDLLAFKDKRLPFLRKENVPLPMESFIKLPWTIKVDSVFVKDSHILVEEISPEGVEAGLVTFDNVNATITGLNNRITKMERAYATLNATGFIMGTGKINARFTLPLDGASPYNAKGTISNLAFTQLNQVLIPMANIRVESGQLNTLAFNFNYTDLVSKGQLEIDYDDLRIIGLNKNKSSTNEVKTFLINVFVKKNNNTLTKLKRVGEINIERDRKRFIFNVWWKSILDGLQSSIMAGSDKRKVNKKR